MYMSVNVCAYTYIHMHTYNMLVCELLSYLCLCMYVRSGVLMYASVYICISFLVFGLQLIRTWTCTVAVIRLCVCFWYMYTHTRRYTCKYSQRCQRINSDAKNISRSRSRSRSRMLYSIPKCYLQYPDG